jgi:hypothetical protein
MTTAALVRPAANAQVVDILRWQDDVVHSGQHTLIGRVWRIVLEASRDAAVPETFVTNQLGVCMDFYNASDALPIAQTLDQSTLLFLAPFKRRDGRVGLPDIPDPRWKAPTPKKSEIVNLPKGKFYTPPLPPMVEQGFEKRARGVLRGSTFLVFGPVAQILVRPEGLAEGWIIACTTDPVSGSSMELLIDRNTGKAHLYGGKFVIQRIG